jgi:hypothetical protein
LFQAYYSHSFFVEWFDLSIYKYYQVISFSIEVKPEMQIGHIFQKSLWNANQVAWHSQTRIAKSSLGNTIPCGIGRIRFGAQNSWSFLGQ